MTRRIGAGTLAAMMAMLVAGAPGPARADQSPSPQPLRPRVEGPWPPSRVLTEGAAAARAPAPLVPEAAPSGCPPATYGVHSAAPGAGKTVALTFDDGPGPTTMRILDLLQAAQVPATFFNLGANSAARPAPVRAEATLDEALGNHTWDHPELPTLTAAAQAGEMDEASAEQDALVGLGPCLFRPPYGEYNATTLALAQQRGMSAWTWSVDPEDWKAGTSTSAYWVDRIVSGAEAGVSQEHPVILLHDPATNLAATVSALPTIIQFYRAHGYIFVDLLGHSGVGIPAPAAVATTALHLFKRGADGALYERTRSAAGWTPWTSLGGSLVGGPGAAASGTVTAVPVTGLDNHVYLRNVSDGGATSGWMNLGGDASSRPYAAYSGDGTLSVVVRGPHAAAWIREERHGSWGPWQDIGGRLIAAPAVGATAAGLTVVAVSTDSALWTRHLSPAGWSGWRRVGGAVTADPTLAPGTGGGHLVAVVRGPHDSGYVAVADQSGTGWSAWTALGGALASAPAATPDGTAFDAFAYSYNRVIYQDTARDGATATGWSGWRQLFG